MKINYPLEQVLIVKHERVEKAEKIVEEKKRALQIEENKLKKLEEERDRVLNHHSAKLAQLRHVLDTGTTSEEVLQMKSYLKTVKEKLTKEETKVTTQKGVVKTAERNLNNAKQDLKKKRLEEEKISLHKELWVKEKKLDLDKQEAKEQDDIGQILYESKRKNKMSE